MPTPSKLAFVLATLVAAAPATVHAQTANASTPSTSVQSKPAATLDDPTIVAIFDAANTWDMETGRLAIKKGRNKDVRMFADMMVRDHKAVRQLGRNLARKLGVTPTAPGKDFALHRAHVVAMRTLRAKQGRAFDKAYIDHEVAYHQAVIDAVTTQLLPATQNAELKALQMKVAPNFQAHLAAGKNLQRQLESK